MPMAVKKGDQVITGSRDHGHMLACGMEAKGVMAELTGRRGGYSKGKGGSMHMFSKEKNFFGGHRILRPEVPIGAGPGLAHRHRDNRQGSITFPRDRAVNPGPAYATFHMPPPSHPPPPYPLP